MSTLKEQYVKDVNDTINDAKCILQSSRIEKGYVYYETGDEALDFSDPGSCRNKLRALWIKEAIAEFVRAYWDRIRKLAAFNCLHSTGLSSKDYLNSGVLSAQSAKDISAITVKLANIFSKEYHNE